MAVLSSPQSPRGFSALARLYYLARPTKTAMLRRLLKTQKDSGSSSSKVKPSCTWPIQETTDCSETLAVEIITWYKQ